MGVGAGGGIMCVREREAGIPLRPMSRARLSILRALEALGFFMLSRAF